ncbi:MAG TPA: TrmH family RNA methyltransferase [Chromatiaceae bacterium]|nr:TrmH family RNA methyltransferase [Chromatiaceae bacterium]
MIDRATRKARRDKRQQALRRYEKHRQRNVLAQPGAHHFAIVLDHLKAGFNVPKIFRSAEVFGASEVHLVGIGAFDVNPAKGAFKSVPARFHDDFGACHADLRERGFSLFALEAGCDTPLTAAEFPERSAFIFGHEEIGLSFARDDYPDVGCLAIPQFGRIESLNVSVAASIVMYEYIRQHAAR